MSNVPSSRESKRSFSVVRVLLVVIPVVVIAGAWFIAKTMETKATGNDSRLLERMGFKPSEGQQLDPRFSEADGDLIADPPKDPAEFIVPEKLIFSYIGGVEAESERDSWNEFVEYLSEKTGKPVEIQTFDDTDAQLAALRDGKLHVSGFNTGAVPVAVNTAGFVPVCVAGRDDGSFGYTMQLIVPTASPIEKLADLKGKKITFIDFKSHSGYKAAAVKLMSLGLLPDRDYQYGFSTSHDGSIEGIAKGEYEAAPVASNLLQRAVANGAVRDDQFRRIYESERFPPAALGYVYNLSPELADKVRSAMLDYTFAGAGLEKLFANSGDTKFVPINYKDDFAIIRSIDLALGQGVGAKSEE